MVSPKIPKAASKSRAGLNPRSRSGCVTCKAKHLKCDETRPACQQCSRKGIKCGGYAQGLRWSFKHQPSFQVVSFESENFDQTPTSPARSAVTAPEVRNRQKEKTPASPINKRSRHRYSISSSSSSSGRSTFTARDEGERQEDPEVPDMGPLGGDFDVSTLSTTRRPSTSAVIQPPPPSSSVKEYQKPPYQLTPSLTDTSSAFIVNWFEQVCPAWSGFDSHANLNRKLAIDLWRTSSTVCSSLESMSAAFIASRLPSMRQSALRLMQRATDIVQAELEVVRAQPDLRTVPTGLLFSLFCVGTTVCWVDARGFGLPFLREAKNIIRRLNMQSATLSASSLDMLTFFNKSLAYCEMLLAVVRDDEPLDQENDDFASSQMQLIERAPHPWTGVSAVTTRLFAESIRLCRSFRHRMRQGLDPQRYFSSALQDLILAQRLEEQLLELEFPPDDSQGVETGDFATPASHLARVAEAYRLSSLLHLYQTFPDLVSMRLPADSPMTESGSVPWDEWIIPLALRLVKVLEHIPTTSGTRVIQPLLYISAATGLRHDNHKSASEEDVLSATFGPLQQDLMGGGPASGGLGGQPPLLFDSYNLSLYISQMAEAPVPQEPMSNMSLDVGSARHFVMRRLSILESSLPPTPVVVAKELVQGIWRAYDGEIGAPTVHWIDVMEDNNLRSMFG